MFWVLYLVLLLAITLIVRSTFLKRQNQQQYPWRKDKGNFYKEDGKLFLNVAYPQKVQAVDLDQLDFIDFYFSEKERARGVGFMIFLRFIKKDGTAGKDVHYMHSLQHPYCPEDMMAELQELGIPYELNTGHISTRKKYK